MKNSEMASNIILCLLIVLVFVFFYKHGWCCNRHEKMKIVMRDKKPAYATTSLRNFVSGITPAIASRQLSAICKLAPGIEYSSKSSKNMKLPEEFDPRKYNFLTPIMNQEMCGGCWAFATVGALADRINFWLWNSEGRPTSGWKSKWRNLVLTPQYLLSCDADPSANGCEGSSSLVSAIRAVTKGQKDMMYGLPNGTFMYNVHPFDVCQHEQGSGVVGQGQTGIGLKCTGAAQDDCDLKHMQFHFSSGTPVFTYKNWYPVGTGNFDIDIQKLKEEIYENGPVVMGISVYENMYDDTGDIKKGVIQTASGQFLGGHAICCHPETQIRTQNGSKRIVDICLKDRVLTREGHQNILQLINRDVNEDIYIVNSALNLKPLRLTKEHPVLAKKTLDSKPKFIRADRLKKKYYVASISEDTIEHAEKDDIHFIDGLYYSKIISIGTEHYSGKVYNLEVENCNEYQAENIIVHNCAVGWGKDYLIIKNSWGPEWGMNGYWYQSITDTSTLSFGGGSGLNAAAGLPDIPSKLRRGEIQIPVIPPGQLSS